MISFHYFAVKKANECTILFRSMHMISFIILV